MNEEAKSVMTEIGMEGVVDVCDSIEKSGHKILAATVGGFAILGAALTVAVVKQKDKIEARANNRRVKKLEKAGYIVTAPEAPVEEDASREDETK
jgi:predicted CoA-binding protein